VGLKMSQTRELTEFLVPRLHPKTVISSAADGFLAQRPGRDAVRSR